MNEFLRLTVHVHQNIFGKTFIEICSPNFTLLLAPFASYDIWALIKDIGQRFLLQGGQRSCQRFFKYKAINQKINKPKLKFPTFYNQHYLEMLI